MWHFKKTKNMDFRSGNVEIPETYEFSDLPFYLKTMHVSNDIYYVQCPNKTLITEYNNFGSDCKLRDFPMHFKGNFSIIKIFESIKLRTFNNFIDFHNTSFIVSNYYDIPQAYLLVSQPKKIKGNKKAGIPLIVVGCVIIFLLIACLIF